MAKDQKWGGVQLQGSDEYKRMCVDIAIRHNLRIANPELAKEVEEKRAHMKEAEEKARLEMRSKKNAYRGR